jgi:hypothetical protein
MKGDNPKQQLSEPSNSMPSSISITSIEPDSRACLKAGSSGMKSSDTKAKITRLTLTGRTQQTDISPTVCNEREISYITA